MKKILAFGEIMLRLSAPNGERLSEAKSFDACYGGTEANVLACLSALGHGTKYLTKLPDNELGKAVLNYLKSFNVDVSDVLCGGDVLGTYFVENGSGSRGSNVIYNRRYSEITKLDEDAFDYDEVFGDVELFHISGISFALSESSKRLAFRLLDEAKKRGVKISFDFNYRAKLWQTDTARECFLKIIPKADIVLASALDLSVFLQTDAKGFFEKYGSEYLFLRNRTVLSADKHSVKVTAYRNSGGNITSYSTDEITFAVSEKIGGGDAFDGGTLHALLTNPDDLKAAVNFGTAAFILKHGVRGDIFTLTGADIVKFQHTTGLM